MPDIFFGHIRFLYENIFFGRIINVCYKGNHIYFIPKFRATVSSPIVKLSDGTFGCVRLGVGIDFGYRLVGMGALFTRRISFFHENIFLLTI